MAKVFRLDIPPQYEELLNKVVAHFDNMQYPTWATRNFHTTRSAKKRNRQKTQLPKVREAWKQLTDSQRQAWDTAKGYTGLNRYQIFTADYIYRRKHGLTLPGTPHASHQLYGLKMSNPTGQEEVKIRLHLKDLIGPLNVSFYYKKTEYQPPTQKSFTAKLEAFYFNGGLNILDQKQWESPTGSQDWTQTTLTINNPGRSYFHLILTLAIDIYNADVYLDNLKIEDQTGIKIGESFNKKRGKEWKYQPFYRKQGWAFYPEYQWPYFEVVYLDQ